ncbi:hypothetical protein [Streptomyces sp. NPDC048411]|uniref:hypothetical protein n=1 Tax=Streptomyces sp. NPDC048411 TaxID=3157206 RepID=UPI0034559FA9
MRSLHGFRSYWLTGAVLLAITSVAGCTDAADPRAGEPPALPNISGPEPSIPQLDSGTGENPDRPVDYQGGGVVIRPDGSEVFPLDAYDSREDETLLVRAETAAGVECMRAKGLDLPASLRLSKGPEQPAPYVVFGVIDLDTVKRYGYREPETDAGSSPSRPSDGTTAAPSAAAATEPQPSGDIPQEVRQAFFDNPSTGRVGCEGKARVKVFGKDKESLFMLLQQYRSEALTASYRDSRVKQVTAKWSACMKESGFIYPNPLAPAHDRTLLGRGLPTPQGASLPPPSPAEIEVAVADVICKRKTQYLQTLGVVNAAYQQQIIGKQATHLRAVQRQQKQNVEAGKKILEAGS